MMDVSQGDNKISMWAYWQTEKDPECYSSRRGACCLLVAEMSDSRGGTMINVTQNEALEAVMSEEKYQTGIQLLPLSKPTCIRAWEENERPKVKAQIGHIQQTSLHLEQWDNAPPSSHLHKAFSTLKKKAATHALLLATWCLFTLKASWFTGLSFVTSAGLKKFDLSFCILYNWGGKNTVYILLNLFVSYSHSLFVTFTTKTAILQFTKCSTECCIFKLNFLNYVQMSEKLGRIVLCW